MLTRKLLECGGLPPLSQGHHIGATTEGAIRRSCGYERPSASFTKAYKA